LISKKCKRIYFNVMFYMCYFPFYLLVFQQFFPPRMLPESVHLTTARREASALAGFGFPASTYPQADHAAPARV
jgi:hypothetical protein